MFKYVRLEFFKSIVMNPVLEKIIEIASNEVKLDKEDVEKLKKEVSYLENAILDVFTSYPDGKIDKASALLYFAYFLGMEIEDEKELSFFMSIFKAIYDSKKNQEEML